MRSLCIALSLFAFVGTVAVAQQKPGYAIHFKIDGIRDTTAYLGYYYGESTFIKDTARVDSHGDFTFDGKQALRKGVYFLVFDHSRIFDIVVGDVQHFTLETKTPDYLDHMKVTGDPDNTLFFQNIAYGNLRHKEAEPFIKVMQDSTLKDEQKKDAVASFGKVRDQVMAFQDDIIARNPTSLTARILKANRPVKVPDAPVMAEGKIDSTYQLRWYREHFFDNLDLSDEAMIQLPQPLYSQKVAEYIDKLYAPHPDTVLKAISKVVERAKKTQETYKYSVFINIIKYQNPEIMGLDEVYVRLYDKYFATGEMDFWVNAAMKKNLKEQADRYRKSLIGKTGPNLIMQDLNLKPRGLYDIKSKYTVLFIFDPDCGHCKTETPKLVNFYTKNKVKLNVEVFAVSADSSMAKMRDYIKTMNMKWITVNGPRTYVGPYQDHYDALTTPTLYVLDEKKKIIAKKIPIEKLEDFLVNYERFHKKAAPKS